MTRMSGGSDAFGRAVTNATLPLSFSYISSQVATTAFVNGSPRMGGRNRRTEFIIDEAYGTRTFRHEQIRYGNIKFAFHPLRQHFTEGAAYALPSYSLSAPNRERGLSPVPDQTSGKSATGTVTDLYSMVTLLGAVRKPSCSKAPSASRCAHLRRDARACRRIGPDQGLVL